LKVFSLLAKEVSGVCCGREMDWGDGREFDLIGAAIVKAGFVGDTGACEGV